MKNIYTAVLPLIAMIMYPTVVAAQYFGQVDDFFANVIGFINGVLVPLLFTLALLVFIWGMFRFFVLSADNESERAKGKQLIIWAIIGFVLMTSIWGIVNIISGGLFNGVNEPPPLPGTPTL